LPRSGLKLVIVVPLHKGQVGHGCDVAMETGASIIAVVLGESADAGGAQPIIYLAGFQLAAFVVGVMALPARRCRVLSTMLHGQDVAHSVVKITLDIRAHRLSVVRMVETGMEVVEGVRCGGRVGLFANLSQVLPAICFDQLVDGTVCILVAWLHPLV